MSCQLWMYSQLFMRAHLGSKFYCDWCVNCHCSVRSFMMFSNFKYLKHCTQMFSSSRLSPLIFSKQEITEKNVANKFQLLLIVWYIRFTYLLLKFDSPLVHWRRNYSFLILPVIRFTFGCWPAGLHFCMTNHSITNIYMGK